MTPGITVKRDLIVFDSEKLWEPIRQKILAEYGASHLLRWVSRRELGFTVRFHQVWRHRTDRHNNVIGSYPQNQVHLDFYSTSALTWFQLKYL